MMSQADQRGPRQRGPMTSSVVLCPIDGPAAAAVVAGGYSSCGATVAPDYPTEFSVEVAASVHDGSPLGPYFVQRRADGVVVGEIGGNFVAPRIIEIGYAVVPSARGQGHATSAVLAFVGLAND